MVYFLFKYISSQSFQQYHSEENRNRNISDLSFCFGSMLWPVQYSWPGQEFICGSLPEQKHCNCSTMWDGLLCRISVVLKNMHNARSYPICKKIRGGNSNNSIVVTLSKGMSILRGRRQRCFLGPMGILGRGGGSFLRWDGRGGGDCRWEPPLHPWTSSWRHPEPSSSHAAHLSHHHPWRHPINILVSQKAGMAER